MNTSKAIVAVSCWFSLAVIASVYMVVYAGQIGDILFGVFLPVGLLVLVGAAVTYFLASSGDQKNSS